MHGLNAIHHLNNQAQAASQANLVVARITNEHHHGLTDEEFDQVYDQIAEIVLGPNILEGVRGLAAVQYAQARDNLAVAAG